MILLYDISVYFIAEAKLVFVIGFSCTHYVSNLSIVREG